MRTQFFAAVIAATAMVSLQAQTTIYNYSTGGTNVPGYTGYFNTSDGWVGGTAAWAGQQGWTGNDALASSVEVPAGSFTPGGAGDNSGTLGFYLPTVASVDLNRGFTPMSTSLYQNIAVRFTAEWTLAAPPATPLGSDIFSFNLTDGSTSLLSFTMSTTGALDPSSQYLLQSQGAGPAVNQFDLDPGSVYRMQIDLVGTTWSGTLYTVTDPSGSRTIAPAIPVSAFTGGTLGGGLSATDFDALNLNWTLASGDPNLPGNLALFANELTISSTGDPIPEPGTWAVGALLLSGAAAAAYRRRKAQTQKAVA